MKHFFLFILLLSAAKSYSQTPFWFDRISVTVSDAYNKPVEAKVEVIGQPKIKFKPGNREYIFNTYFIEKADYPVKQDTLYYLKISAAGYPTVKQPLAGASMHVYMFKPGEKYVYEGYNKVSVFYDNRYLACIQPNAAKLDSFCTKYNLKIVSRFDYCNGSWKGYKEGPPNTYIVKRNDGKPFGAADPIIKAFRETFPYGGGTFYCRYQGIMEIENDKPKPVLIYNTNEVELYGVTKAAYAKIVAYSKTIAGVKYNDIGGLVSNTPTNMHITLPLDWNIEKVNAFMDKVMAMGIAGGQATGITALNCPG